MNKIFINIIVYVLITSNIFAQQPNAEMVKVLESLKQSGLVKQQGNHIIFVVKKASDTSLMKMMYQQFFASDKWTLGFEVAGKPSSKPKKDLNDIIKTKPQEFEKQQDCVTQLSDIFAKQKIKQGNLTFKGNVASYTFLNNTDSVLFKSKYPCKIKYQGSIYDVVMYSNGNKELDVANTGRTTIPINYYAFYEPLLNPDFEINNTSIPHWKKTGTAFNDSWEGNNNFTWEDTKQVTLGGNYWTDLEMARGRHLKYWMTSLPKWYGVSWKERKEKTSGATGTLTSTPFKINRRQKALSFLIAGGKDEENLKVELLQIQVQPRVRGNLQNQQQLPGINNNNHIETLTDTLLIPVDRMKPKTGNNNDMFCRVWWQLTKPLSPDLAIDTSKYYVIRITDNSTARNNWGYISVDDFKFIEDESPYASKILDSLNVIQIKIKDNINNTLVNAYVDETMPVYGSSDTHTHLMSHLSMGGKLMYGAPDVGSLMTGGTNNCNPSPFVTTTIEQALGNCNSAHGGWGLDNTCGNYFRAMIINAAFDDAYVHRVPFERNAHGDHPHAGYPNFEHWPHHSSISHQQMYVDWIKRAYDGGLRVLVSLAVNNELLGNVVGGDGQMDDKSAYDLQIDEMKNFVQRHNDFMEVAYSAKHMKQIILSGKMAVILGIEVDNFGNFNYIGNTATEAKVKAEIKRVYDKGVRYIFPIHLTDNAFGGMAVYSALFAFSNKYAKSRPLPNGSPLPPGNMLEVETARDPRITYKLKLLHESLPPGTTAALTAVSKPLLDGIGEIHLPPLFDLFNCPTAQVKCIPQFKIIQSLLSEPGWDFYNGVSGGHVNKYGLTPIGKFALKEMMKLGMIVDIDHMSEKSVADALNIAEMFNYPVASGHNGLRENDANENSRTEEQTQRISRLKGLFGVGVSENDAQGFLRNYRKVLREMGNKAVTMGSDINGFVTMPHSGPGDRVKYGNQLFAGDLKKYTFYNKTWDYNTDGMAHIGLYPDYYQALKNQGMNKNERQVFFNSADYIYEMWNTCITNKVNVR